MAQAEPQHSTVRAPRQESNEIEAWTIKEAAKFLRISPRTIDDWIYDKKFTATDGLIYIGGRRMVLIKALMKGIVAGAVAQRPRQRQMRKSKAPHGFAARKACPIPVDGVYDFTQAP